MANSILITGGSGKVGFQLVQYYLKKNYVVITTTRNITNYLKQIDSVRINTTNLHLIEVDFSKKNALNIIQDFIITNNLKIETVIHNARNIDYLKLDEEGKVSTENFNNELFLGVVFPYELVMILVNLNIGLNNIIFVSSMYGVVGPNPSLYDDFHNQSPINYGVGKAAQIHMVKELAIRLAPNIRTNCISFGGIKGRVDDEFLNRYKSLNPQRHMLEENEVVAPLDFLVSDSSKNMTGQNVIIDNGWTLW